MAKYILTGSVISGVCILSKQPVVYLISGLLELAGFIGVVELTAGWHRIIGNVLCDLLVLILLVQYMVLYFGGTYVSMIMMTNLHALSALRGKAGVYIGAAVMAAVIVLLPVRKLTRGRKPAVRMVLSALTCDLVVCCISGAEVSAFYNLGSLEAAAVARKKTEKRIEAASSSIGGNGYTMIPREDHGYVYTGDERPDVVVFFTEGMSQNIVDDARNIMPNVRKYENESLSFVNYYNHTAATFRGIPCQLHSGFQFEDMDENGLASMEDVFSLYGYETTLINPEPYEEDFSRQLSKLGFDRYISDQSLCEPDDYIHDAEMYSMAYDLLVEDHDAPQLIVLYTFGTHVTMDSPDEVYGDGSDPFLNKFYNVDVQLGKFMDKVLAGDEAGHTMVVFTTDHASYVNDEFAHAFSGEYAYTRAHGFCDEIPFFIWYQGVVPEAVDVRGRTSLDMSPTVLDYLGMDCPSDFLGSSLFGNVTGEQEKVETMFCIPVSDEYFWTGDGNIRAMSADEQEQMAGIVEKYCARARSSAS